MHRAFAVAALSCLVLAGASVRRPGAAPAIVPNDNRHSAGTLTNGVLTVRLEARQGLWSPEGPGGRSVELAAWGEPGKPPQNPGPLIRVTAGTEIRATVRNTFEKPLIVYGLGTARGMADSMIVPARSARETRFKATAPGTYYYIAKRGIGPFGLRPDGDFQLNGALIVDPAGTTPAQAARDRVFILSWWFKLDSAAKTGLAQSTMTINGLSWPHTERIDMPQGDSVHWRVINLTEVDHPMHLHGFYFRVESKGTGVADSIYGRDQQRLGVTEVVQPFATMSLSFLPDRPGNWIYHCHYAGHVSHLASMDDHDGMLDEKLLIKHQSDRPHQMYGLVLGLRVAPRGVVQAGTVEPRQLRLIVREKDNVYGKLPGYAFVLGGTPDERNPAAMPVPGPALVLERGQPVAITVVNHSRDRAAVHWHGIELQSYPDGVPGWSGSGKDILPSVAPGDSITVRFTPPRAGTFMYHSHFNEFQQISSGLYGPIIVTEPGQRPDTTTDRVLVFGAKAFATNVVVGPFPPFLMNGEERPAPMTLSIGKTYRFRVINIAGDVPLMLTLNTGAKPVIWRAVAKDGATLPALQATMQPAVLVSDPGEIYDFEFTPSARGELALRFGAPDPPPGTPPPPPNLPPPPPTITVPVHVR